MDVCNLPLPSAGRERLGTRVFFVVSCFPAIECARSSRHPCPQLDARFCKLRDSASHFMLLQFGLATFQWDEDAQVCVREVV